MCQNCNNKVASVHFTQIINDNKVEMHLCEQCAKDKGHFGMGAPLSINDFFTGLIGLGHSAPYIVSTPPQPVVCDKCGMSYEEFQKTGKMGCSNCYEIYGDKLKPMLKRLHGNAEHHGKVPAVVQKALSASKKVDKLKEELKAAIQNEEYEKAAEIRDKIRNIESV